MKTYAALMIDIKNSRGYSLSHREEIQSHIAASYRELNRLFADQLEREVEFSAGDELQGLFCTAESAYCYLRLFRMLLWPVQVRAGIGVGRWDVRLPGEGTTAQDGQAYHRCRSAIKEAEEKGESDIVYRAENELDEQINFAMSMESLLTRRYSSHQNDLLLLTELLYPVAGVGDLSSLADVMEQRGKYEYYASREKQSLFCTLRKLPVTIQPRQNDRGKKSRGIPTAVSNYSGISRQSVEKTMKAANMFAARNAAMMALKLLAQRKETP